MKRNLQALLFIGMVIGMGWFSSCSKDERPFPVATVDFEVTTIGPEVAVPVTFENNSINASLYVWEYGDGSKDSSSTIVNASHIYDDPGNYTVKLRAYNDDGVFAEAQETISVGERFLIDFGVYSIGEYDFDGNFITIDSIRGIDLMIEMGPLEDESRRIAPPLIFDSVYVKRFLPQGVALNEDYVLTDEDFYIALLRVDSTVDDTIYRTLLDYTEFNPLNEILTVKSDDGSGGIVIEPLVAVWGFQYVLSFEID